LYHTCRRRTNYWRYSTARTTIFTLHGSRFPFQRLLCYNHPCEKHRVFEDCRGMSERSNEEWLQALRGPQQAEALADLRALLMRGIGAALTHRDNLSEADLEDFVQNALLKILDNLDRFRGESRFTTWAHTIAVREAYTELRRRRWRDVSLDAMATSTDSDADFLPDIVPDRAASPEDQAVQRMVLETMRQVIEQDLTEKQRQALVGTRVDGLPLEEVARRMGTNRNALYKLLHDARRRLQKALVARGLSPEEVLSAFGAGEVRTEALAASDSESRQL
jgi:RNA polymerase sigma-70 factor (ECF subfamily)